ncbi:carbohydrate kinase family protein, partial [Candidatus Parcubacteria bacterium]|nr:carbohydrate kinase family protein [Candidatus Parcubacteria bacterium]
NDAAGEEIAKRLKQEGVSLQFLEIDETAQTSTSCLLTSSTGEHTIVMYRGKNDDLLNVSPLWSELEKTKWLYLTDVASTSEELTLKVTEVAESKKINLAFVPGQYQIRLGKEFFSSVLKTCEIFILNRHEAETILGAGRGVEEMLQEFIKMGTKIAVITDDKNGVHAADGKQTYKQSAPPVEKPVDTTGAGDAFASGFVAARISGKPVEEALSWGNKNAGSVISQVGAQPGLLRTAAMKS